MPDSCRFAQISLKQIHQFENRCVPAGAYVVHAGAYGYIPHGGNKEITHIRYVDKIVNPVAALQYVHRHPPNEPMCKRIHGTDQRGIDILAWAVDVEQAQARRGHSLHQ